MLTLVYLVTYYEWVGEVCGASAGTLPPLHRRLGILRMGLTMTSCANICLEAAASHLRSGSRTVFDRLAGGTM